MICLGKDGKKDNWAFSPQNPEGGLFKINGIVDFDKDLVLWNGVWVRAPLPSDWH